MNAAADASTATSDAGVATKAGCPTGAQFTFEAGTNPKVEFVSSSDKGEIKSEKAFCGSSAVAIAVPTRDQFATFGCDRFILDVVLPTDLHPADGQTLFAHVFLPGGLASLQPRGNSSLLLGIVDANGVPNGNYATFDGNSTGPDAAVRISALRDGWFEVSRKMINATVFPFTRVRLQITEKATNGSSCPATTYYVDDIGWR